MEEGSRRAAAAAAAAVLPDELILEILTRLPFKSLCRCKCVSPAWRALISDPANRRRFAHTLSGLFFQRPYAYGSRPALDWDFIGLSMSSVSPPPPGVDTALCFLPPTCGNMELLDSCNGLLLLCCAGVQESPAPPPFYVVCNPATGEWVTLPQPSHVPGQVGYSTSVPMDTSTAAVGFDPSMSPHFHVFQLVQVLVVDDFFVQAVEIYSSQTGRWVLSKTKYSDRDYIKFTGQMTYFKGFLHICIGNGVASVNTGGQKWRIKIGHYHHLVLFTMYPTCISSCHNGTDVPWWQLEILSSKKQTMCIVNFFHMFHCGNKKFFPYVPLLQGHYHHLVSTRNASQLLMQGSTLAFISLEGASKLDYFTFFLDGGTICCWD